MCLSSISSPTPDVHWVRTDGRPLPDRAKIQSFGQELMIGNLQFEDAGTYECWATNTNTQSRVQRTVTVRVECETFLLAYDFVTFYASFFCFVFCFLYLCDFFFFLFFFLWVRGGRGSLSGIYFSSHKQSVFLSVYCLLLNEFNILHNFLY